MAKKREKPFEWEKAEINVISYKQAENFLQSDNPQNSLFRKKA